MTTTDRPPATVTLTLAELEAIIQHAVRQAVREELAQQLRAHLPAIRYYLLHEGPDDPAGDAILLQEALADIAYIQQHPESLMAWEDVKAEIERAEAAGELPA